MQTNNQATPASERGSWPIDLGTECAIASKWAALIRKNRKKFALSQLQHRVDVRLEPALQLALQLEYNNDQLPLAEFSYKGHAFALRYDENLEQWVVFGPNREIETIEDQHLRVFLLAYLNQIAPVLEMHQS